VQPLHLRGEVGGRDAVAGGAKHQTVIQEDGHASPEPREERARVRTRREGRGEQDEQQQD
jgi:hypothetical protein